MMATSTLAGRRVLLVEDELMVAMLVETALEDESCIIVGPYGGLSEALLAAQSETLDLAVLDINLAGEMVFPVAEMLASRGVPFLLLSGYGALALPKEHEDWPICAKPFRLNELVAVLNRLVKPGAPAH